MCHKNNWPCHFTNFSNSYNFNQYILRVLIDTLIGEKIGNSRVVSIRQNPRIREVAWQQFSWPENWFLCFSCGWRGKRGPSVLWMSLKSVDKYNTRTSITCIRQSLDQKNSMYVKGFLYTYSATGLLPSARTLTPVRLNSNAFRISAQLAVAIKQPDWRSFTIVLFDLILKLLIGEEGEIFGKQSNQVWE